jgi:voltage-gated potassium channel
VIDGLERVRQRAIQITVLLAALLLFGTAGFILVDGYGLFDAFYMTAITITTVGYFEVQPLTHAGRVFNTILLLFGVVVMFYIMGSITQLLIEIELGNLFGKRRNKKMINQLKDHYIICGYGRVGRAAAQELARSGKPFLIIDHNEGRVERAMRQGLLAVNAEASHDDTLREVGVERAKGLIAALATDADNLYLILSAKTLNPLLNVVTRVSEEESVPKMKRAGADAVLLPYTVAGSRLAQAIVRPHVFEFLDVTSMKQMGLDVGIEQVRVAERCALDGKSLRDLQLRRDLGIIVLAIRRADSRMDFNPAAETTLHGDDHLIVMGDSDAVRKLEELVAGARP